MRFRIIFILILAASLAKAQTKEDYFIKELIEGLAENLPEDYDLSEFEERLGFFKKHPINLNHTNQEELKTLLFLTPIQINSLFIHIKDNGKLIDVLELQSIAGYDLETIGKLVPFVTVKASDLADKITYRNILKFGENDLVLRLGSVIEKQKGFSDLSGSKYLGSKERFLWRYKFSYSNRISASLILEKDAGEQFIKGNKQILLDFQSVNVSIYNVGAFKKIMLGDYSLQFGQGLTLWTGFGFGKSPDVSSLVKKDIGLKAYGSANEYSFLRGFATTISIAKNIDFTSFMSIRNLDGSLSSNNENETVLSTLNETGLHRTSTEITNKNSTQQRIFGGVIQYQQHNFSIAAIAYQANYKQAFITGLLPYKHYYFSGKRLTNLGLNYTYTYKNLYLFGEIGESSNRRIAYLNGALISLSSKVSAIILQRNYNPAYHNFFNQAIAEASEAVNENGLYVGLNITPSKAWLIAVYADYFKFLWLKFRVDAPSSGHEILGQLTYAPTKFFKTIFRYKTELKQQNTDLEVPINFLDNVKKDSYRMDVNWKLSKSINLQNRLEFSQFKKGESSMEIGYLIYQDVDYSPLLAKITGNVRLAYFNTPSFNSRIYAYEDDVLYNFTFGMYNGKGIRSYVNLKYKLIKKLDLWARYAVSRYSNQATVGSGLDEINGNTKSDVKLQLRYQF